MTSKRQEQEIEHGRRIVAYAEEVWNRDSLAGRRRLDRRFEDLQRFLAVSEGETLLELGCGTGLWTKRLAALPIRIVAVELSPDLVARARREVQNPRVEFLEGDAERLPHPDQSFRFVCGLSVLHHLDIERTLREVWRVLQPGGRVWFSEPNMLNPQILVQKNIPPIKRWAGDTPGETAFFRWPLRRKMRAAGFSFVDVQPFDFLHPALPDPWVETVEKFALRLERLPGMREIAGSLLIHAVK